MTVEKTDHPHCKHMVRTNPLFKIVASIVDPLSSLPALGYWLCTIFFTIELQSQEYTPGSTYFGKDAYIEYHAGNLPFILSVPHGGHLEPSEIPNRNCENCAYVKDAYTQELAREIIASFVKQTGCYPHAVFNLLHRKKLDMNRDLDLATDSNTVLHPYWNEYHQFINSAKKEIVNEQGKGLFIDLHGHGHLKQRIELGYLLYGSELRENDEVINSEEIIEVSSIENLARQNASSSTHAQLIRGDEALGTQFALKGYPGVPSRQDPYPLPEDLYFNGGYNTFHHGSSPGGSIDAIQLELYSAIRFDSIKRVAFADSFVTVVLRYLQKHYFPDQNHTWCATTSSYHPTYSQRHYQISPNPTSEFLQINSSTHLENGALHLSIYNAVGQMCKNEKINSLPHSVSLAECSPGVYWVHFHTVAGEQLEVKKMVLIK